MCQIVGALMMKSRRKIEKTGAVLIATFVVLGLLWIILNDSTKGIGETLILCIGIVPASFCLNLIFYCGVRFFRKI